MTMDATDSASTDSVGTAELSGSVERVIDVAIEQFSELGFADAKLDNISRLAGMSKRMIHYHFGDKKGLYQQALSTAARRLNPPAGSLDIDSAVPVEGVRTLVDWLFKQHVEHPEAIRMMTMETSTGALETGQALTDVSEVSLHLDKLLMLGQDSGAFRPGISANDIFTLIASLTMYRVTNRSMMQNLLDIDMHSPENTEGMHRMAVDTVLAFLTANIPDSGYSSYLSTGASVEDNDSIPQDIYSSDEDQSRSDIYT